MTGDATWTVGDRVRRKNGVIGTVTKVCRVHPQWAHPRDHCELRWSDGKEAPMSMLGLRRLERL